MQVSQKKRASLRVSLFVQIQLCSLPIMNVGSSDEPAPRPKLSKLLAKNQNGDTC